MDARRWRLWWGLGRRSGTFTESWGKFNEAVLRATEEAMEAMVVAVMEGVTTVVMVEVDTAAVMVMEAMEAAAMTGDKNLNLDKF